MNKKILCTAIGGALTMSVSAANAYVNYEWDFALVPYVVKDTNRTTVVTVIFEADSTASKSEAFHAQYWTKSTTDANTAACQPSSVLIPYTNADIVTFDTAGLLGYPLFGDTTNPAPLGASISYAAPRHGYLLVQSGANVGNGNLDIESAYWMELDLANGGAYGDQAPLNYESNYSANESNGYLGDNVAHWYLYPDVDNARAVAFWPSSVVSTAFTVTPLGTNMLTKENNQVVVQVINNSLVQGAYDRNENGVDGTVPVTVRCVGRVTPAQLMPGVVANAAWAAQGGWGYLANLGDNNANNDFEGSQDGTNSGDLEAIVYQIDSSSAGGKFMSNATRITTSEGPYYVSSD